MGDTIGLFCFPHAGGTGRMFHGWSCSLVDVQVSVLVANASGMPVGRTTVGTLAERGVDLIEAAEPCRFALFGHSLGALVAFEVARELHRRRVRGPEMVFVSGRGAPHRPAPGRPLHELPSAELWREIGLLGGTEATTLDKDLIRSAAEPRMRRDFHAVETYRYRPGQPLECEIVALVGTDDLRAPRLDVEAWRMHTLGSFDLVEFVGGHFFIDDHLSAVLGLINARLGRQLAVRPGA